jgi:hypothetical protein
MRKNTRRVVRGVAQKRNAYEQFNFVLTSDERKMLDEIAERDAVSASHAVRTMIREKHRRVERNERNEAKASGKTEAA